MNLRCIHRHTISEHPACFARGLINQRLLPNKVEKAPQNISLWYQNEDYRIGYLDIETDGLTADFGTMLTWCVKEKDGEIFHDEITKEEIFDGVIDYRIVKSLIDTLKRFAIIVTYYGTGFDVPFVRSKALRYRLDFPNRFELFHWDVYYTVKSKLALSRNSLDNVCDYLNIKGKTSIDKDAWRKAKYGDQESLKKVLDHNLGDVRILEQLHNRLEPFAKWTKKGA